MEIRITLRPYRPDELDFLERVYATTRADELAQVPWTDAEKAAFVHMQFQAQHDYYHEHYAGARFDIIEADGERLGRMYVYRTPSEIRLMDIALLPQYRGRGIGTGLITALLDEARANHQRVSLHVERHNPAFRLYRRLGFVEGEEGPIYVYMEWNADDAG